MVNGFILDLVHFIILAYQYDRTIKEHIYASQPM